MKDGNGNLTKHDTCFTYRTVESSSPRPASTGVLRRRLGTVGYFWNAYNGIHDVFHDEGYWNAHVRSVDNLVADIEAERLPPVTWVTPRFELSDHPP